MLVTTLCVGGAVAGHQALVSICNGNRRVATDKDNTMRAACTHTFYGPISTACSVQTVPRPVPSKGEVLVKVSAASVNFGDIALVKGAPWPVRLGFGLFGSSVKILGCDVAGVVEAVGPDVSKFSVGDKVFGDVSDDGFGSFAEYVCCAADVLSKMPASVSFSEAAALPSAAVTALQGLRDHGALKSGERVLIHGAGGGVGHFAAQLALALGAGEVHVATSTKKLRYFTDELKLPRDRVVDYSTEDVAEKYKDSPFDVVLDAGGYRSLEDMRGLIKDNGGRYVFVGGDISRMFSVVFRGSSVAGKDGAKMCNFLNKPNASDLEVLRGFVEEGRLRAHVNQEFDFEETVEAMSTFEDSHPLGKIIIKMM
eukprot:PhM_4_TR5276/c0_g1_i1/m.98986